MNHLINNDYRYNKRFRDYVDSYAAEHDIAPEEALEHDDVRREWRYYTEL